MSKEYGKGQRVYRTAPARLPRGAASPAAFGGQTAPYGGRMLLNNALAGPELLRVRSTAAELFLGRYSFGLFE